VRMHLSFLSLSVQRWGYILRAFHQESRVVYSTVEGATDICQPKGPGKTYGMHTAPFSLCTMKKPWQAVHARNIMN
jgi:hypothetical protein